MSSEQREFLLFKGFSNGIEEKSVEAEDFLWQRKILKVLFQNWLQGPEKLPCTHGGLSSQLPSPFCLLQIKVWTANPQQFVEDEDDDTFSYTVRIAAQDLLLV